MKRIEGLEPIAELAKTLSRYEIAAELGVKYEIIVQYCRSHKIDPVRKRRVRGEKAIKDAATKKRQQQQQQQAEEEHAHNREFLVSQHKGTLITQPWVVP